MSRKKTSEHEELKRTIVYIKPSIFEAIEQLAKEEERTYSNYVAFLLKRKAEEKESDGGDSNVKHRSNNSKASNVNTTHKNNDGDAFDEVLKGGQGWC